jgi:F1F0 ATPase subunit 2
VDDAVFWVLAGLAGMVLGGFFFGGVWWTVQKLAGSTQPGLWLAASLGVRVLGVLAGFLLVGGGSWRRSLACLLGFLAGRFLVARYAP